MVLDLSFSCIESLGPLFLLLLFYGFAITPWMYIYSFLFESPTTAYVMLFCLNFFSGLLLLLIDAVVVVEALDYVDVCYIIIIYVIDIVSIIRMVSVTGLVLFLCQVIH